MAQVDRKKLRVGVVGIGKVGIIHARAYLENPSVELVGICNRKNKDMLMQKSKELQVPGYTGATGIAELIDKGKPDLVNIVIGHEGLLDPIRLCLDAGVNVLSEKPISFEAEDILPLINLAESKKVQFGVNFNQRFTRPSQWFKQLREEGEFGEMLWTIGQYNQGLPRFDDGRLGLSLKEHMIHQLDFWHYHIGETSSVTGQAHFFDGGIVEDAPDWTYYKTAGSVGVYGVTLEFVDGQIGVFTNGAPLCGELPNYYELVGTKGRGFCENFVGRAVFRSNEKSLFLEPPWIGGGGVYWDTFATHLDLVVEAMLNNASMPVPAQTAFDAICVCDAIVQAVNTGCRTEVDEIKRNVAEKVSGKTS